MAKPPLSKTDNAVIGFCLDESYSMTQCKQPTIDGFNDWLKSLRKQKGSNLVTLTQFSQVPDEKHFRITCENTPAKDVKKLTTTSYSPRGNTPLFDAIGHTITVVQKELNKYKRSEEPAAIVVIQTDGQENVSTDYTRAQILKLIEKKEKAGWTFTFLGANMTEAQAQDVAASVGLPAMAAVAYAGATTMDAFAASSDMINTVKLRRSSGVATASADAGNITRSSYKSRTESTTKTPEGTSTK